MYNCIPKKLKFTPCYVYLATFISNSKILEEVCRTSLFKEIPQTQKNIALDFI